MTPVRWSNLRYMADCPAVYKYVLDNGTTVTPAMRFGSAVHAQVLGVAHAAYVVYEGERRGNAWKEFKENNASVEIVTSDEMARAVECANAILNDPTCGKLIHAGVKEHRLEWMHEGRACAGTPDVNGDDLIDLKITPMVSPTKIVWHARKMLWHAQVAWYENGIKAAGGSVRDKYLICCTPKPPYLPVAYRLTDDTVIHGTKQWWLLFEQLIACEAADQWPGYAQDVLPLDITEDTLTLEIGGDEWEM